LVGLRVLVADDEAFSLSIIGRMLREMGCKDVLQADNGASTGCNSSS
jgi:CheY-like chemotaxis protein